MRKAVLRPGRQTVAVVAVCCFAMAATSLEFSIASEDEVSSSPATEEAHRGWLGDRLAESFSLGQWSIPPGAWSQRETENFLVYINGATDDELDGLEAACEACLATIGGHLQQEASVKSWRPKCIVVLHRTPESYENALGQRAPLSWGCTTIKRIRGAITYRRIDICATTRKRLAETFPHELTHVVLADHFAGQLVPRWLDEGLAVLAEPSHKIVRRAEMLDTDSGSGPLIRTAEILTISHYPPGQRCHAFYVESAQLVHLLLREGGPQRLFRFAEAGVHRGYDAAAREHYGLAGLAELDQRRQQNTSAGLMVQASRERMGAAAEPDALSSVAMAPFSNASYPRTATPTPPARGR